MDWANTCFLELLGDIEPSPALILRHSRLSQDFLSFLRDNGLTNAIHVGPIPKETFFTPIGAAQASSLSFVCFLTSEAMLDAQSTAERVQEQFEELGGRCIATHVPDHGPLTLILHRAGVVYRLTIAQELDGALAFLDPEACGACVPDALQTAFVARQPAAAKQLARLLGCWAGQVDWLAGTEPSEYLLELLALWAVQTHAGGESDLTEASARTLFEAALRQLAAMADCVLGAADDSDRAAAPCRLSWTAHYSAELADAAFPGERVVVLDPANPAANLAAAIRDWRPIRRAASSTLGQLAAARPACQEATPDGARASLFQLFLREMIDPHVAAYTQEECARLRRGPLDALARRLAELESRQAAADEEASARTRLVEERLGALDTAQAAQVAQAGKFSARHDSAAAAVAQLGREADAWRSSTQAALDGLTARVAQLEADTAARMERHDALVAERHDALAHELSTLRESAPDELRRVNARLGDSIAALDERVTDLQHEAQRLEKALANHHRKTQKHERRTDEEERVHTAALAALEEHLGRLDAGQAELREREAVHAAVRAQTDRQDQELAAARSALEELKQSTQAAAAETNAAHAENLSQLRTALEERLDKLAAAHLSAEDKLVEHTKQHTALAAFRQTFDERSAQFRDGIGQLDRLIAVHTESDVAERIGALERSLHHLAVFSHTAAKPLIRGELVFHLDAFAPGVQWEREFALAGYTWQVAVRADSEATHAAAHVRLLNDVPWKRRVRLTLQTRNRTGRGAAALGSPTSTTAPPSPVMTPSPQLPMSPSGDPPTPTMGRSASTHSLAGSITSQSCDVEFKAGACWGWERFAPFAKHTRAVELKIEFSSPQRESWKS